MLKGFTQRERYLGAYPPPFYYGLAYRIWDRDYEVYAIMPLNYFMRWGRAIHYLWDKFRGRKTYVDKIIEQRMRELEI